MARTGGTGKRVVVSRQGRRRQRSLPVGVVVVLLLVTGQTASAEVFPDQVGVDLDGVAEGDSAGALAMSADGNRIAIGSPGNDGNGEDAGHVRVFDWDGDRWQQVGADIEGEASGDGSGTEVALSADGGRLAVAAPYNDGASVDAGHVRVFDWDGDRWQQVGADIDGMGGVLNSGRSIELSGDGSRLAIGAVTDDGATLSVVRWNGLAWTAFGSEIEATTSWGRVSVAMSAGGDRMVVGAPAEPDGSDPAVRVFDWGGSEWIHSSDVSSVDPLPRGFGSSVALNSAGDRLAIGATGSGDLGPPGGGWLFDLVDGSWVQIDERELTTVSAVRLSADGQRWVLSGAGYWEPYTGTTIVRDLDGGEWADAARIAPDDPGDDASSVALAADGLRLAIGSAHNFATGISASGTWTGQIRVFDLLETPPLPRARLTPIGPVRLLETREGNATVDGTSEGIGRRAAGSVTALQVTERAGIPDAEAVMMNVAVANPAATGYLTVFPCGPERPLASSLNYVVGQTVSNSVLTPIGESGMVCVYTEADTEIIIDATGFTPLRAGLFAVAPARILDSRSYVIPTGYEDWLEIDRLPADSVTRVWMTGRGGVPNSVDSVLLNVAVVQPENAGYLTLFSCDTDRPLVSSLNYAAGQTSSNMVFTKTSSRDVCIYSSAETKIVVDSAGYTRYGSGLLPVGPARLLESRIDHETVDGESEGIGRLSPGTTTVMRVAGREELGADASGVMLDVAAMRADGRGYLTVYPCGTERPVAASLNFLPGVVTSNAVFTGVGENGTVCIRTSEETDVTVDVVGQV